MRQDRPIGSDIPTHEHSVQDEVPREPTTGALFLNNRDFVIQGGNFTNINYPPPSKPPNFREIPMGDLILNYEIPGASNSKCIVRRHNRKLPNYVRRIYSAEIVGLQSPMTARVLEGPGAEEAAQLQSGCEYISSIWDAELSWNNYTVWIRLSKGVLHMELEPPESRAAGLELLTSDHASDYGSCSISSLLTPPQTSVIIDSLSLDFYHGICHWYLGWEEWFTVPTNLPIQLGSISHVPIGQLDVAFQIAVLPEVRPISSTWGYEDPYVRDYLHWIKEDKENGISLLDNGWIRVDSGGVLDRYRHTDILRSNAHKAWMAQAAHILSALDIHSNLHQYAFFNAFHCFVDLVGSIENLPTGYLFLCPARAFTVDGRGHYTIPNCPAYWSLDPSGEPPLTAEEASKLGFPELRLQLTIAVLRWSDMDYAESTNFMPAKAIIPMGWMWQGNWDIQF
ncbi:hypothetical protein FB45DRAFT_1060908 [Roridomyces roridus]|uniref:Uncharacterized protein n=1 Tax=Roridomyces roridus TaxID=1738132 RepID=A0AAD7FK81_9AGAR|nr:hypothetical protein FB45DRAFT_1060908 [Roridomyces roridus]